jgi:hypothetical protein
MAPNATRSPPGVHRSQGSGPGGRWFESTRPDQLLLKNQLVGNPDFEPKGLDKRRCPFLPFSCNRRRALWLYASIGSTGSTEPLSADLT